MSTSSRSLARGAVAVSAVVLLGVVVFAATERAGAPEPGGVLPYVTRDAGPVSRDGGPFELKDAEIALVRLDGAVQLHLPSPDSPPGEQISPEQLQTRRREQIELITERIDEVEAELAAHPGSTVLQHRLDQLRTRRDTLLELVTGT